MRLLCYGNLGEPPQQLNTLCLNCRSAIPVCTATLAILIEHRIPSHSEAIGLILLSAGVMTTVWEVSASGSMTGVLLCCAGTVCSSAMMSTTGKIMSEKLDVLRLIFYTAPVSCAVLLPLCYIIEVTIRLTVPTVSAYAMMHGGQMKLNARKLVLVLSIALHVCQIHQPKGDCAAQT